MSHNPNVAKVDATFGGLQGRLRLRSRSRRRMIVVIEGMNGDIWASMGYQQDR